MLIFEKKIRIVFILYFLTILLLPYLSLAKCSSWTKSVIVSSTSYTFKCPYSKIPFDTSNGGYCKVVGVIAEIEACKGAVYGKVNKAKVAINYGGLWGESSCLSYESKTGSCGFLGLGEWRKFRKEFSFDYDIKPGESEDFLVSWDFYDDNTCGSSCDPDTRNTKIYVEFQYCCKEGYKLKYEEGKYKCVPESPPCKDYKTKSSCESAGCVWCDPTKTEGDYCRASEDECGCFDGDGINKNIKSKCIDGEIHEDECTGYDSEKGIYTSVKEWYCDNGKCAYRIILCENKCENGRCVTCEGFTNKNDCESEPSCQWCGGEYGRCVRKSSIKECPPGSGELCCGYCYGGSTLKTRFSYHLECGEFVYAPYPESCCGGRYEEHKKDGKTYYFCLAKGEGDEDDGGGPRCEIVSGGESNSCLRNYG